MDETHANRCPQSLQQNPILSPQSVPQALKPYSQRNPAERDNCERTGGNVIYEGSGDAIAMNTNGSGGVTDPMLR
jgi:hypothetical protein